MRSAYANALFESPRADGVFEQRVAVVEHRPHRLPLDLRDAVFEIRERGFGVADAHFGSRAMQIRTRKKRGDARTAIVLNRGTQRRDRSFRFACNGDRPLAQRSIVDARRLRHRLGDTPAASERVGDQIGIARGARFVDFNREQCARGVEPSRALLHPRCRAEADDDAVALSLAAHRLE